MGRKRGTLITSVAVAVLAAGAARAEGPMHLAPGGPEGDAPDAGPPARLFGQVRSRGIRTPLPLATLVAPDGGVLAEADGQGRFTVSLPAGTYPLEVRASGHRPLAVEERLAAGDDVEVLYRLERVDVPAYETVVHGRRLEGPARVELSRVELHEVAGTMGDPFRVTMLMPGVAAVASGLAYPVVRGTQPASTGFFLDGVRLPQLYHLLAGPAVVHPDFIERVDFFPGVTPARYGRLLGGVLDGQLARPPEQTKVTATVDLLNAGAFVSVPVAGGRISLTAAGRVSYTGPVATAVVQAVVPNTAEAPRPIPVVTFGDYQGRVEWDAGPGRLRLLVLGAMDEAGTRQAGPGTVTALLSSVFHRADVAWRQRLGGGKLEVGAMGGTERLGLLGERDGVAFGRFLMRRELAEARARWVGEVRGVTVDTGAQAERQLTSLEIDREAGPLSGPAQSFREPRTDGTLLGAWAEVTWTPGPLLVQVGVRGDAWLLDGGPGYLSSEPRLLLKWTPRDGVSLRAAAGFVHQAPTVLVSVPVSDLAGLRDGLQQSVKTEAGVDVALPLDLDASVTGFLAPVPRAIEYSLEDFLTNRARLGAVQAQPGRAYGLEVMVRRKAKGRWFGWLSYTLMRSERLRAVYDFDDFGDVSGQRQAWVPFAFDQTHVLNLVGGVALPRGWRVSAGVRLNTGRPESGVVSSRAMRAGVEPGTLLPTWVPVSLTAEPRLPGFLRLDARVAKRWDFDDWTLEAFLDVLNATANAEVLGYSYLAQSQGAGRTLSRQAFSLPVVLPYLGVTGRY